MLYNANMSYIFAYVASYTEQNVIAGDDAYCMHFYTEVSADQTISVCARNSRTRAKHSS